MSKIKIGLFGVGHLGKIHLKCLQKTDFDIVGVFDPNLKAQEFIKENTTYLFLHQFHLL